MKTFKAADGRRIAKSKEMIRTERQVSIASALAPLIFITIVAKIWGFI